MQITEFALTADEWSARGGYDVTFAGDVISEDRAVHALDRLRRVRHEFERVAHHPFDGLGSGDGSRCGDAAHAGGEIGSEPIDVVLGCVEVDESTVNADTNADVESESRMYPLAQRADRPDDVEAGVNGPMRVVLVSLGMAEHRQQTVALGGPDVAFVVVYDFEFTS